jgi:hypothetical protein
MLEVFYKVQMLLTKKKQLANVLMERIFISESYREFLEDDETVYQEEADKLRAEMVKKMEAKEPLTPEEQKAIMDLEEKAKKVLSYKNILNSTYTAESEINHFIEIIKQNFWK